MESHCHPGSANFRQTNAVACFLAVEPEEPSPHFSRQTSRGGPLRPPREALAGLGCVIEWDGVCISRMGGHGGPPLQIKSVQRRSSERW